MQQIDEKLISRNDLIEKIKTVLNITGALTEEDLFDLINSLPVVGTTEVSSDSKMDKDILYAIINHYGKPAQTLMLFEEMAELMKEICKNNRGEENRDAITEEFADVQIMLEQVKLMYEINKNQVDKVIEEKLDRTITRIGYKSIFKG